MKFLTLDNKSFECYVNQIPMEFVLLFFIIKNKTTNIYRNINVSPIMWLLMQINGNLVVINLITFA